MMVTALAACSKKDEGSKSAAKDDTVKITQATPPPGGSWADVVNATPAGVMMGNPDAKVKLIEIGSLSCPHCKALLKVVKTNDDLGEHYYFSPCSTALKK